jgi:hypothetical protein
MNLKTVIAGTITCLLGFGRPAAAQPATSPAPEADAPDDRRMRGAPAEPEQTPIRDDDKRALPDYDGRDEPTTAGDVLIWVPRIVLSPLYLVSEFVVRRPLGAVVTWAEKEELPRLVVDFFTFGPEDNIGIIPTALVDFGFKPSVGLYHFWNDFIARDNKLRLRASTWGPQWLLFKGADRLEVFEDHELSIRGEFEQRPDWVFYGLGPRAADAAESRFSSTRVEGGFRYEANLWQSSRIRSFVAIRSVSFDPAEGCCGDPTVAESIAQGVFSEPPGLSDGYAVIAQGVDAALDTRPRRQLQTPREGSDFVSPPGTGIKLDLRVEHAGGLDRRRPLSGVSLQRYEWMKYGATLAAFLDLTQEQRVIGLSAIVDFVDPLRGSGDVPFTEQVTLGGERPLHGFLHGRLVGRSSAVGMLDYRWPVWVWLDGTVHYAVGNVFDEHLAGFELGLMRQSFGIGLTSTGSRDHAFQALLAFGTNTFDDGSDLEHVRVMLGTTSGF